MAEVRTRGQWVAQMLRRGGGGVGVEGRGARGKGKRSRGDRGCAPGCAVREGGGDSGPRQRVAYARGIGGGRRGGDGSAGPCGGGVRPQGEAGWGSTVGSKLGVMRGKNPSQYVTRGKGKGLGGEGGEGFRARGGLRRGSQRPQRTVR